jgi:hypothetical protein
MKEALTVPLTCAFADNSRNLTAMSNFGFQDFHHDLFASLGAQISHIANDDVIMSEVSRRCIKMQNRV